MRKYIYYKTKDIFEKLTNSKIYLVIDKVEKPRLVKINKDTFRLIFSPVFYQERLNYRCFTQWLSFILFDSHKVFSYCRIISRKFDLDKRIVIEVAKALELFRTRHLYYQIYPGAKAWDQLIAKAFEGNLDFSNPFDLLTALAIGVSQIPVDEKSQRFIEEVRPYFEKLKMADYTATTAVLPHLLKILLKYYSDELVSFEERVEGFGSDRCSSHEESEQLDRSLLNGEIQALQSELRCGEGDVGVNYEDFKTDEVSNDSGRKEEGSKESSTTKTANNYNNVDGIEENNVPKLEESYKEVSEFFDLLDEDQFREMEEHSDNSFSLFDFETSTHPDDYKEFDQLLQKTLDEIIEESLRQVDKRLEAIKEEMLGLQEKSEDKGIYGKVEKNCPELFLTDRVMYEPMWDVVNRLRQIFRRFKGKEKEFNDIFGQRLDLFEEIQEEISDRMREVFLQETNTIGFSVVILLDCSGSMDGLRMHNAATACLTLYETLKDLPFVDLEVYGFSGILKGLKIMKFDRESLRRVKAVQWTPTWMAVRYVTNILERKSNNKRLLIIITDGLPQIGGMSYSLAMKLTADEIKRARRKGIQVFTFFIQPPVPDNELINTFGSQLTIEKVEDVNQLPKKLINFVVSKIYRAFSTF